MKIRDKLLKALDDHALFEDEAKAIIEAYEKSPIAQEAIVSDDRNRLDDDEAAYPPAFYAVIWIGVRDTAYEWLGEHKPNHWVRPAFAPATTAT